MKFKNSFLFTFALLSVLFLGFKAQAATISPNIFTDELDANADCSLREAIEAINQQSFIAPMDLPGCAMNSTGVLGTDDTVVLQAGPYVLTIPGNGEDSNAMGDLDVIGNNIAITGAGSEQTSIDASGIPGKDRVIQFEGPVVNASITGVTITGGDVSALSQAGGGIHAFTLFLNLQDVQVILNKSNDGGGIRVFCQPSIIDSVVQDNESIFMNSGGNGGGIVLLNHDLCGDDIIATIDNTAITDNTAEIRGGGIYIDDDMALIMNNSTVDSNTSQLGCGGGFFNDEDSVIGITNSTISRNQALDSSGGGICDNSIFLFLTNTTVSTNTATNQVGTSHGGGISSSGGLKGLYNVTIAFNQADAMAGGVYTDGNSFDPRFDIDVFNTIVAQNSAPMAPDCYGSFGTGGYNLIGDIGNPGDCNDFMDGVMGDQVGASGSPIDPLLGALQLNGGTTETHALDLNSPAVDRGNDVTGCQALDQTLFIETLDFNDPFNSGTIEFIDLAIDQRFFTRPIAILDPNTPICDIGAFELQTFSFALTKDDGLAGATIEVGDSFTYTIVMTNNGPGDANDVMLSDPLPPLVSFVSLTTSQGSCAAIGDVVGCDLGDILNGDSVTVTITVTAIAEGDAVNTATVTTSVGDFIATVTTHIGGVFIEGSGCHCNVNGQGPNPVRAMGSSGLLVALAALFHWQLRRRATSR